MLSDLHQMIYQEHLATMTALTDTQFNDERDTARSVYSQYGRLRLPWLRWAPKKTIVDSWNESRERRKDPEYMANLWRMQNELDAEAAEIAARVKAEVEMQRRAREFHEQERERARRPIGRRYGKATRRRARR
jgi:hypothetical protein